MTFYLPSPFIFFVCCLYVRLSVFFVHGFVAIANFYLFKVQRWDWNGGGQTRNWFLWRWEWYSSWIWKCWEFWWHKGWINRKQQFQVLTFFLITSTVCPRSLEPLFIVSYYIKWVKTPLTYNILMFHLDIDMKMHAVVL